MANFVNTKNTAIIKSKATEEASAQQKQLLVSGRMSGFEVKKRMVGQLSTLANKYNVGELKKHLLSNEELVISINTNPLYKQLQQQGKLEKYVNIEGIVTTAHLDDFNNNQGMNQYFIQSNQGNFRVLSDEKIDLISGSTIQVNEGQIFSNNIIVKQKNIHIVAGDSTPKVMGETNMPRKYGVIMINFLSDKKRKFTTTMVDNVFRGLANKNSVKNYYKNTLGVDIDFDIYDWITIDDSNINRCDLLANGRKITSQNVFDKYKYLIYLFNYDENCNWDFYAATFAPNLAGQLEIIFPFSYKDISVSYRAMIHEIGHHLGFDHSGFINLSSKPVSYDEYGNFYDPMSAAYPLPIGNFSQAFSARVYGLEPSVVSSDQQITLNSLANKIQLVKILNPISQENDLYLDLRAAKDYDAFDSLKKGKSVFIYTILKDGNIALISNLFKGESFFDNYSKLFIKYDRDIDPSRILASISFNSVEEKDPTYSYKVDTRGISYCWNKNENSCINTADCQFYKACNRCAHKNTPLSFVCPDYCPQFNNNGEGCVASQNRQFGCAWYDTCKMCINEEKDGKTPIPSLCPNQTKQLVRLSGQIVVLEEGGERPKRLDLVLYRKNKSKGSASAFAEYKRKTITNYPEKNIPYLYSFTNEDFDSENSYVYVLSTDSYPKFKMENLDKSCRKNWEVENGCVINIDVKKLDFSLKIGEEILTPLP